MNMNRDKEAINQFLNLGKLLGQIQEQHPSMSEADILRVSRLMTTVATGTQAPQEAPKPVERPVMGKPGRKVKLANMTPEERQERILSALDGSDGMLAGDIAKTIGLRGAQGLSPMLVKLGKAGLVRSKSGAKGQMVWVRTPVKASPAKGKSMLNGRSTHAAFVN
jgi:hypothetical protein